MPCGIRRRRPSTLAAAAEPGPGQVLPRPRSSWLHLVMNVPVNLALTLRAAPPCLSVRALAQGAEGITRAVLAWLLYSAWRQPPHLVVHCQPLGSRFAAFCAALQAFVEYPFQLLAEAEEVCFEHGPEGVWSHVWPLFAIRLRGPHPPIEAAILPLYDWVASLPVSPCTGPRCACCLPQVATGNIARNLVADLLSCHPGALRFLQAAHATTAELATLLLACQPRVQSQLQGPSHALDILEAHATLDALRCMPLAAVCEVWGARMFRTPIPVAQAPFWHALSRLHTDPE